MPICWIGIGANVGDASAAFDTAWSRLALIPGTDMGRRSGLYQTQPVGAAAGGTFINAVFSLTTSLPPNQLLDELQSVETSLGRVRDVRWGPRTVDLDLLFIDDLIISEPRLSVPHPAAWYRRFVLDPLTEAAPALRHPLFNETISSLRERTLRRPLTIAVEEPSPGFLTRWHSGLSPRFPMVRLASFDEPREQITAGVRLEPRDPSLPAQSGIPVADLTSAPGDAMQRVCDFLTAVLDEPVRIGDW